MSKEKKEEKIVYCPDCNTPLQVLLFMGEIPEGFVCPKCQVFFDFEIKKLASIIC